MWLEERNDVYFDWRYLLWFLRNDKDNDNHNDYKDKEENKEKWCDHIFINILENNEKSIRENDDDDNYYHPKENENIIWKKNIDGHDFDNIYKSDLERIKGEKNNIKENKDLRNDNASVSDIIVTISSNPGYYNNNNI